MYLLEKNLDIVQTVNYDLIKEQIEKMQGPITFGSAINVLLITDRLYGCSFGLMEYLQNSTDITVDLVNSLDDANKIISVKSINFLIIVGYLNKKQNYDAIQSFRKINKYSSVIIYAILDAYIYNECKKYEIRHSYERFAPVDGFISYMRTIYDEDTRNMHNEVSVEAVNNELCR